MLLKNSCISSLRVLAHRCTSFPSNPHTELHRAASSGLTRRQTQSADDGALEMEQCGLAKPVLGHQKEEQQIAVDL